MAAVTLSIRVRMAWWFRIYIWGIFAAAYFCNCEPDPERVEYWANKALRCTLESTPCSDL
jgi:hypothetical protein